MSLSLQLVNETTLPDGGPVNFRISGKRGIDIGRDAHLDWTLPDPTRYISSKHCEIRYKDGGYWLHDVSTNGTFLNGADHRMSTPHRLRNGDRFTVGHYIVAVTVEGEEGSAQAAPQSAKPASAANYEELWASQGDVPPPIDPKQLKPGRQDGPVHSDFLDWAADVPDPFHASGQPYPAPPLAKPAPAAAPRLSTSPDMAWAEGPPSHVPAPPPPPLPNPAPRRPGWDAKADSSWDDVAPATADRLPGPAALAGGTGASEAFVRQLARAAGLSEDVLAQKDPDELAQQVGAVLGLVAESLMQLLNARRQAKRLARSSSHTTVQAVDNNPLKFCPSAADALRIMFGPTSRSYLDAHRAIGQGFDDLKAHQVQTYAAMQHAIMMLMADFDPKAIEKDVDEGRGVAGLLASRKAKLWDTYEAQWHAKIDRAGGGPVEAFLAYFAEAYDRDGG